MKNEDVFAELDKLNEILLKQNEELLKSLDKKSEK